MTDDLTAETLRGRCTTCGHEEDRPPEELEPGSRCVVCDAATFGFADDEKDLDG